MAATAATRGRADRRAAILASAFTVFAREGYAAAGVDVVATEAGVAKATVYNHFGDKETLLRAAIVAVSETALADNLAAVEQLADHGGDLADLLETLGMRLLHCYCDDRSWALRRLISAELNQFPDLLDIVEGHAADRVLQALADRLARLTVAGRLHTPDPVLAAEQLNALLTGPMDKRGRLGTRVVPEDELRAVARAAITTFLRAFGPAG